MKIKELHIRNIASIEKADIDFEKELTDSVTGEPSGIFLISGDTGTGKTMILDAITMALYKKTPRIVDVANKQNNEYTDNQGQSVSINSIEQYTRMGISEKDECYSQLVFEGNDGAEYHARLDLGLFKSNKDANGNRLLKHRTPKWQFKKGVDDWQRVDSKGQVLVDAVGLSFEQFGRMAMLAQGQFAAFLTGDKSERESILEQLTNTSKFTLYGKAVSNLFSLSKLERNAAQTVYDSEKEHTLPPEKLEMLANDLSELKKQKESLDNEYKKDNVKLQIVDNILEYTGVRVKFESDKAKLLSIITSDEYQQKKQLINDWDTTNQERQLLVNKLQAEMRKSSAEKHLSVAREDFTKLSSDLLFRENKLKGKKEEQTRLMTWINERMSLDNLFTNAKAIDLLLCQYKDNLDKINENKQKLEQEKKLTGPLRAKVEACVKAEALAQAAVASKQEVITKLQSERTALNPQDVSREKDLALKRKTDLEKLYERIVKLDRDQHALSLAKEEIAQEEKRLVDLAEVYLKSQSNYEQKAKEEASARSLLNAMQMSLEDTLTELRRKMQDTHADTCPLCGQQIETLHIPEDFKHIMTPLQQREEEAKMLLDASSLQRDKDKSAYDKAKGALYAKKHEQEKAAETIRKENLAVKALAELLQLVSEGELIPQIEEAVAKEAECVHHLDTLLKRAEELQTSINHLSQEKQPLDEAVYKAGRVVQEVRNEEENNLNKIIDLENAIASFEQESTRLVAALNSSFFSYLPVWQEDILFAQQQLKTDAEVYNSRKKEVEILSHDISMAETQQEALCNLCNSILSKQAAWAKAVEAVEYKSSGISSEWTKLYAQIEHQLETYNDSVKTLNEASESLALYYAFSSKTEEDLLRIIAQEKNVAGARKFVNETDGNIKSCNDAIADATKRLAVLLKELEADKLEDVPDKDSLQQHVNELALQQQDLAARIGAIEEKLKTNSENEKKLEQARLDLDKSKSNYDRWERLNKCFGGTRFRTLVQTYILRPLLNNANIYLDRITDRYTLTCSEDNEQLSILVLDRYNKNQIRSVTVLSGGERFMISLALSLALSSLNRQDMNVNILFIDEGFGTLDETNLNSVMTTLERLQEIAGQSNRRVGIISHREELVDRIPVKIRVRKKGEGRSIVEITQE